MKHLNPRQGITTQHLPLSVLLVLVLMRVKHLNPRQGITTSDPGADRCWQRSWLCETPKSPPGDYNMLLYMLSILLMLLHMRVKHLNPHQGITTGASTAGCQQRG